MDELAVITVLRPTGNADKLELPLNMSLSLMEALKASEYPILATCGGIALCATCHVRIIEGGERLRPPGEEELAMLDTLPDYSAQSRLSCQVPVNAALTGVVLRIAAEEA